MKEILTYLDNLFLERCVLDCVRLRWDPYLPLFHMRRLRCGQSPKRLKMRHETLMFWRLQKGRLQGKPRLSRYPLAKFKKQWRPFFCHDFSQPTYFGHLWTMDTVNYYTYIPAHAYCLCLHSSSRMLVCECTFGCFGSACICDICVCFCWHIQRISEYQRSVYGLQLTCQACSAC